MAQSTGTKLSEQWNSSFGEKPGESAGIKYGDSVFKREAGNKKRTLGNHRKYGSGIFCKRWKQNNKIDPDEKRSINQRLPHGGLQDLSKRQRMWKEGGDAAPDEMRGEMSPYSGKIDGPRLKGTQRSGKSD